MIRKTIFLRIYLPVNNIGELVLNSTCRLVIIDGRVRETRESLRIYMAKRKKVYYIRYIVYNVYYYKSGLVFAAEILYYIITTIRRIHSMESCARKLAILFLANNRKSNFRTTIQGRRGVYIVSDMYITGVANLRLLATYFLKTR